MAVFLLTAKNQDRLLEAKRLAVENPVPLNVVKRLHGMARQDEDGLVRGKRLESAPHPQEVRLSFGWRINLSVEEQPIGLCLHLSISSPTPKKTMPHTEAIKMVLDVLDVGKPISSWVEEFRENGVVAGKAVNVLVALT